MAKKVKMPAKKPVAERKALHQEFIPGCEPQEPIPEIDEAAREWFEAKDSKKMASEDEADAFDRLARRLQDNGLSRYEMGDGTVIDLGTKTTLKAKKKKKEASDEDA